MIGALGICSNGAGCVGAWVAPIGEHACQDNARCFGGPVEPLLLCSLIRLTRSIICSKQSHVTFLVYPPLVPIGRARLASASGCAAGEYARGATQ